jgi:hypothetical protein
VTSFPNRSSDGSSDPSAALAALLGGGASGQTAFPPTSRYHGLEVAAFERPDGSAVAYVRRRFIAGPEQYSELGEHRVGQGERLDLIAAALLGDPEQFWRICDANAALDPADLEVPGTVLRITLPEGIPGAGAP